MSTITDIQNNTAKVNATKNEKTMGSSDLGQDAFLQLLMTQLKYQDPLNPMNNQDFLAQQAQFTQLSELQKLNTSVAWSNQVTQANSLIGKKVELMDPDDPEKTITGVVSEARFDAKGSAIVVGDKEYPLSLVKSIKEGGSTSDPEVDPDPETET